MVGGGLAGVTTALALADAGVRVTLLEGRPRLGGLAFSFQRGDLTVDNGQHVYLRCCTAYRWFLDRIGGAALAPVQDRLDVPVVDLARAEGNRLGRLRRDALPVPLHLGRSLAAYPHLSLAERASVGRAALALKGLDLADPTLDTQDFGSWLTAHGQSARAVEALWDLVGVATLNAVAGDASLGLAAMVFKTGLLSDPGAADIGWARVPLGELHDRLARKALDSAGVRTEVRTRVTSVSVQRERRLERSGSRRDARSGRGRPRRAPARGVRPAAGRRPGRPGESSADRHRADPQHPRDLRPQGARRTVRHGPRHPGAVGLRPYRGLRPERRVSTWRCPSRRRRTRSTSPVAALRERYLPELERLLPRTRGAEVKDFFVTRERTATFAPAPGVGRLRPGARTKAPGLYLAGAWTATGWPATMESAVRSGVGAAAAALGTPGRTRDRLSDFFEEAA